MAGSVYEGKTYDEAVRKGLEALRLTRAEAVITTIEEGKGGFLGIGARPFRVSVARRPGGAIREPAERTVDDRRGRKGTRTEHGSGREERTGTRGRRGGGERSREAHGAARGPAEEGGTRTRGGRDRAAAPGRGHGRRSDEEPAPRGRSAGPGRGGRGEAPAAGEERETASRPGGSPRPGGERPAPSRREAPAREARPPREAVANVPPAAEPRPAAAMPGAEGPMAEGEGAGRKRRRRGRRGGRGRRRGPAGAIEGSGETSGAPVMNGDDAPHAGEAGSAYPTAPAPEERYEPARSPAGPPAVAPREEADAWGASAPEPSPGWAPAAPSLNPDPDFVPASPSRSARETEARPTYAARDTMEPPVRPSRTDRGERHRARPETAPDMNADELSSTSRRLTEELLQAMGFEPRVSVRVEGNRVDVTIEVDRQDDLLNGRQGETRQAIQHLLNRFLNKGDGSRYHLQLEINDHWHQREEELAELAHRLADEAATRQVEVVSDHLNSQERRIVHMTLREDARVKTYSLGDGPVKRVAVAPASFPDRSENDPAS